MTTSPDYTLARRERSVPAVRDAFDRTYRTDSLDRLVQRGIGTAGKFQTFDYDVDGRLAYWIKKHQTGTPTCVNVSGGWGYDCSVGGVATDAIVTATYDNVENPADLSPTVDPGNRLRAFNGVAMNYDADGNMVKRVGATTDSLEWDDFGQLKRVIRSGSVIASFDYDGFGRRIRKTTSTGGTTTYVWDGDQIILEADGSGATLRGYSYYPGTDRPHTVSTPSNAYLMSIEPVTGDVNGLIRASDNAVVAQYAYTPWGELEVDSTNIGNSLRWKGLVYDRETGLYYVRARYYDAKVRRFISEDPIGLGGGINVYDFASADPINRSDPSGLDDKSNGYGPCYEEQGSIPDLGYYGPRQRNCGSPELLGPAVYSFGDYQGMPSGGGQGGLSQRPLGQTTGSGQPASSAAAPRSFGKCLANKVVDDAKGIAKWTTYIASANFLTRAAKDASGGRFVPSWKETAAATAVLGMPLRGVGARVLATGAMRATITALSSGAIGLVEGAATLTAGQALVYTGAVILAGELIIRGAECL